METLCCLACGVLAGLAAWVALPSAEGGGARVSVRAVSFRARRVLVGISDGRVVATAMGWPAFRSLVEEVERARAARGRSVQTNVVAAVLVVALGFGLLLACAFARSPLAGIVVGVCTLAGIQARRASRERNRRQALSQEMPAIFRTLATAMSSGNTLVQAIDYVGLHERGQANEAFVRASLRLRCGWSVDDVLERLRGELEAPGVGLMATALEISQRTGSPLRDLFQRSAVLVEQQGEFERMLSVKTAQVRLSVRIVCLLPPIMVCLLSLISPDYLEGLSMPSGMVCLLVAVLMDCAAVLLIRRIMGAVL